VLPLWAGHVAWDTALRDALFTQPTAATAFTVLLGNVTSDRKTNQNAEGHTGDTSP